MDSAKTAPRIFAFLFRRVGDSLMATPALRALRLRFPQANISVVCESHVARVFQGNDSISEIVSIRRSPSVLRMMNALRSPSRPDIVLDFLSNPRTALATAMSGAERRVGFAYPGRRWAYSDPIGLQNPMSPIYSVSHKLHLSEALGCMPTSTHTEFTLFNSDTQFAFSQWQRRGLHERRVVAFFVHSRRLHKRWPLERFAEVIRRLLPEATTVVPLVLSTPGDESAVDILRRQCALHDFSILRAENLGQLGAVLKRCALLIGNDGGPKHLAIALDVPTLTIFGTEPPEYWTPPADARHGVLCAESSGHEKGIIWPSADDVLAVIPPMIPDTVF